MKFPISLCFAFLVAGAPAADIVLSPKGPIQTPLAARDAARKAEKPVRIVVEEGTYAFSEALQLGAEDSHTTWEAASDAKPVWSGGKAITDWKEQTDGVWKVEIPEARDGKWAFEQLWVNSQRATRARMPNKGYFHLAGPAGQRAFGRLSNPNFHAFAVEPEEFAIFQRMSVAEREHALVTVTHAWAVGQCRIKDLHAPSNSVLIQGKSHYPFVEFEPDQRYWMENFREAFDAPSEWYLDTKAGALYYRPKAGEKIETAIAPVASQFLVIRDAKDIAFKGIAFQFSHYSYPKEGLHDIQAAADAGGSIEVENSKGVEFSRCEVAHTGDHAIYFKNGCADSVVRHSHLHDLGGSGVRVGETTRPSEERVCRRITVDDCIIQHGGRLHPSACGAFFTHTQNCAVTHCDIGDFYYTGVSAGWNWGYGESFSRETRVENNHIHHLGWAYLSDMGGFYGLGNSPGTIVRGNHVHHVASHRYGGWGLYNDEGSSDVLMENNLVHDTSDSGFHQHYGYANRIRNNIFAFGKKAQIQRSRNEPRLSFVFEQNIVVWDPSAPLLDGGEWNWKLQDSPAKGDPRDTTIFRKNLYWPTNGQMPDKLANKWTWAEWQKMGRDAGSVIADPMFEDIAKRNFRLKNGSPANKIGFQPWDLEVAGVRAADRAWRELAAKATFPEWDSEAKPWPAPIYKLTLQTFESVDLDDIGIRNARADVEGKGDKIGVTDEVASPLPVLNQPTSKRSLRVQDAPGLSQSYKPVLSVDPGWDGGVYYATFDVMAQAGADWFFEMRESGGGEFAAGPILHWIDGKVFAGNRDRKELVSIPAGEWFRVSIEATPGTGRWGVTITRQNGTSKQFAGLSCKPEWNRCHYLLWSGTGKTNAAFFIDNLRLWRSEP